MNMPVPYEPNKKPNKVVKDLPESELGYEKAIQRMGLHLDPIDREYGIGSSERIRGGRMPWISDDYYDKMDTYPG